MSCSIKRFGKFSDGIELIQEQCTELFKSTIKVFCFNRARQRRKLVHLIRAWASLNENIESCMNNKPDATNETLGLQLWVCFHHILLTIMCFEMGFELELYSFDEYHQIFWYLNFLYNTFDHKFKHLGNTENSIKKELSLSSFYVIFNVNLVVDSLSKNRL